MLRFFGIVEMDRRIFRNFPTEALVFAGIGLAVLSWTAQVQLFRLDILRDYEHVIIYVIIGLVMMAAKGFRLITILETSLLIWLAAIMESLKFYASFRHPKTSDFYADITGIFLGVFIVIVLKAMILFARLIISRAFTGRVSLK